MNTKPGTTSVSQEDYLKAVLEAESEGSVVIPALLASRLGVTPPAVTKAVKRLREEGYLDARTDGPLRLTSLGKSTAYRTALRHYLIERMLAEMFGMAWHEVHSEAERLEHAVSPEFEAKLLERLGEDGLCPHGNAVLPESPGQRKKRGLVSLAEAVPGKSYAVSSLLERDAPLLLHLHRLGIGPKTRLKLVAEHCDETLEVETEQGRVTLGRVAAHAVWVKAQPELISA